MKSGLNFHINKMVTYGRTTFYFGTREQGRFEVTMKIWGNNEDLVYKHGYYMIFVQ